MDVKNLQSKLSIKHLATADYDAGDVIIIGSLVCYALEDITSGDYGEVVVIGQGEVTKIESQAWTIGQKIYWDSSESEFTSVATDNTFAGIASDVAASSATGTTGRVLFNCVTLNDSGPTATNVVELTDNSGGVDPEDDTIAEIADIALSTSDTYTDAAVNGAVNTAIASITAAIAQLAAKQAEILAALEAASLMATT